MKFSRGHRPTILVTHLSNVLLAAPIVLFTGCTPDRAAAPNGVKTDEGHGCLSEQMTGQGTLSEPFIFTDCSNGDTSKVEFTLLQEKLSRPDRFWRVLTREALTDNSTTYKLEVELLEFGEKEISSFILPFYFRNQSTSALSRPLASVIGWSGQKGAPELPYQIGWMHFRSSTDNVAGGLSTNHFDQTIWYEGGDTRANVYVYAISESTEQPLGSELRMREFERAIDQMRSANKNVEEPWPPFDVGAMRVQYFIVGDALTVVGLGISGKYFVKIRLTFLDDLKVRELMAEFVSGVASTIE